MHVTPETHRGPSQTGSAHAWLPIAVGLLAIAVAGWKIWVPGMWHDEVATLVAADRSLGSLARMLREVDAGALITHRLPVAHAVEAYRLLDQTPHAALQVLLEYEDG